MRMPIFTSALFLLTAVLFSAEGLQAQNRRSVGAAEATGTFRSKEGSEFKILALGKNKLKVQFSGIYEYKYKGEPIANIGEASGTAVIQGDTAVFKPEGTEGCTITIKFLPNQTIKVLQSGSDAACGFGHNVYADDTYRKTSRRKPVFKPAL
jgi:hypothetical protein